MEQKERLARFALAHCPGVGPANFQRLLSQSIPISIFLETDDKELIKLLNTSLASKIINFRNVFDTQNALEKLQNEGIKFVVYGEKDYPEILKNTSSPPICIYYKGEISACDFNRTIAIVGSRRISDYGETVIKSLVENFVQKQFIVVSGMAFGVDKFAHLETINNGGKTVAVLASSVNIPTPAQNLDVYNKIIGSNGLIISEAHLNEPIAKGSFPRRNRLIAGLSMGTLVIEAAEKSGALITADIAFSEGRSVFAIPGNINRPMSRGTNWLIKTNKAKLVENTNDILEEFGYLVEDKKVRNYETESEVEKEIIEKLRVESVGVELLKIKVQYPLNHLLSSLSILEFEGVIHKDDDGKYRLVI